MKKALLKLLILCMAFCFALCVFTACEGNDTLPSDDGTKQEQNIDDNGGEEDPTPDHQHVYTETVVAPTCTEQGYTLHKCSCGEEYKTDEKAALGHNYEWTTTKAPTETEKGTETGVCSRCKDTITRDIPKLNHEHNYIETVKAPTCTEQGYTLHKCSCGDEYKTDEKAALGHSPAAAVEENRINATCTTTGGYDTVVYCAVCGTEISRGHTTINATGHEFTNYVSDGNATYESDGTKTAYCNHGCGAKNTITDVGSMLVKDGVKFNSFSVNDSAAYGKVPNSQSTFNFLQEVQNTGKAKYTVSTDRNGNNVIASKNVDLNVGDNQYYITVTVDDEVTDFYSVIVRRRTFYNVYFNSNSGTSVSSQRIEEDSLATEPTTTRAGYTFTGWNYDFTKPITSSFTINASWTANTNTPYKVEYYLQNLENDNYTLTDTDNLTGTTDTTAIAQIKSYAHFTPTSNSVSGNINGNNDTALQVYYTRDKYYIHIYPYNSSVTIDQDYDGYYKYGYEINDIVSNINKSKTGCLGYECGWFSDNNVLLCSEHIYKGFTVEKDIIIIVKYIKDEMLDFEFDSDKNSCVITGVKDKTKAEIIVPNGVTSIGEWAFDDCSSLTSITIPDSVTSIVSWSSFWGCSALAKINYMGMASEWVQIDGLGHLMSSERKLYINNELLTNVALENTTEIKSYAFYKCTSLKSVTLGNSIISIGGAAFEGCSSLTSITIPDSVTSIGDYAFRNCSSLTSVTIPDSVTSIGSSAFTNCSNLTSVYYNGTSEDWSKISIKGYNSSLTSVKRYYYSETTPTESGNYWHYDDNGNPVVW